MERITISIDEDLLGTVDALMRRRGYPNRSEALRDLLREATTGDRIAIAPDVPCIGILSYVYDHDKRDLARRMLNTQHDQHDLSIATLHVHISAAECLEVVLLRGSTAALRDFADALVTQRGVRHGHLHLVPANRPEHAHDVPAAPG